jgi:hypothetical protein
MSDHLKQNNRWINTLSFNPINSFDEWAANLSFSSFVFSLTNNDKFILEQPQKSIFRYAFRTGINFGRGLFNIMDKGNKSLCNQTWLYS